MRTIRYNRTKGQLKVISLKHSAWSLFLLPIVSLIISCAPTYQKPKIDLVWPLPPDEPKIKYVDTISSTLDLGKQSGLAETLFGEERIVGFSKPYGVAVDKEGRIYVADVGKVVVLDLKKKDFSLIGNMPGTGQLRIAIGVAVADDGRVFVTDAANDRVNIYINGKYAAAIGETGELESPTSVALDEKLGLVYIVDAKKHQIIVYSLIDYKKVKTIGTRGSEPGEFNFPMNVAVDPEGKLYVVDSGNFRVQIFDKDGKYLKSIGKLGDTAGSFARPKGIAIDSEGHIYVVDTAFQNIQIFDQEGRVLLFFGEAGSDPGHFILPAGLGIDREDKIYVVDQLPGSVQIFQYVGEKYKKNKQP